ncbi:MAG: hypothetical protein IJ400_00350 [Clostridia bacterium]|nr:hypothetical protein [Clostridia bacterium]
MQDTKNNNIKETSFADKLNQISQCENEKEKAKKLLDSLIQDIKANRQEYIDKSIEEVCVEIKDKLEKKVKLGEFVTENGKKRVYVYHEFVRSIFMPRDFQNTVYNTCKKLECIFDNASYIDIQERKLPLILHNELNYCHILYRFEYWVCKNIVESVGFFGVVMLNNESVKFAEKLKNLLEKDGVKFEGIVACSYGTHSDDGEALSNFMKKDHKTKNKGVNAKWVGSNPLLKFSMEF